MGIIFAAVVAAPAIARAETPPNVWDIAVDPQVRDRWTLHSRVLALLFPAREGFGPREKRRRELEQDLARGVLEAAHAASSPDVRLQFDLGRLYETRQRHASAVSVLKGALAAEPNHPLATHAHVLLSSAYAHLGATEREREEHETVVKTTTDVDERATSYLNLGESDMRLGELDRAVGSYNLAIAESSKSPFAAITVPLAEWGLAVAHDRRGDRASAYLNAQLAFASDPAAVRVGGLDDGVYYVPAYERYWYLALAATVYATEGFDFEPGRIERQMSAMGHQPETIVPLTGKTIGEGNLPKGAVRWGRVEYFWQHYIDGAADDHSRETWIERAREHLAEARREKLRVAASSK